MSPGSLVEYIVDQIDERLDEAETTKDKIEVLKEVIAYCEIRVERVEAGGGE